MNFLANEKIKTFIGAIFGAFLMPLSNYLFFEGTFDVIPAVTQSVVIALFVTVAHTGFQLLFSKKGEIKNT